MRRLPRPHARLAHPARLARAGAALAALLAGGPALADAPVLAPAYVSVREADVVTYHRGGDADLRWVDAVGVAGEGAVSIPWFDVQADAVRVAVRLRGRTPASLDALVLVDAQGDARSVPIGRLVVRPDDASPMPPLRPVARTHRGSGPLLGAWHLRNDGARAVTVRTADLGPAGGGAVWFVAPADAALGPEGFDATVAEVRSRLAAAGDAPARDLRTLDPHRWRAGDALDVRVPPGGGVTLALPTAALPAAQAGDALRVDVRLASEAADGATFAQYLPAPVVRAPAP